MQDISNFIGYLRNPQDGHLIQLTPRRTAKTINLFLSVVMGFYDYLFRTEQINYDLSNKLAKTVSTRNGRKYKDFLYHITTRYPQNSYILTLKESKKRIEVLTKGEVITIYSSALNIRDRFLIRLLFETGMRIGEALSLFIEDFHYSHQRGHSIYIRHRGELENMALLKSGEREIPVSQGLMDLFDDYVYEILDTLEADTNFVFIKLRGKNAGKPMTYSEVSSLFKRLRAKTGINVHPHLFRHTHASIYYSQVKDLKHVQERLGHVHIQTTAGMYVHIPDEQLRQSWESAQKSFSFEGEI